MSPVEGCAERLGRQQSQACDLVLQDVPECMVVTPHTPDGGGDHPDPERTRPRGEAAGSGPGGVHPLTWHTPRRRLWMGPPTASACT